MIRRCSVWGCFVVAVLATAAATSAAAAAELYVGAAQADITPPEPVALCGQFHLRVAQRAETPITAQVLVLESRDGDQPRDAALMAACDVVGIPAEVLAKVRAAVQQRLPEVDAGKLFLSATHTHTAPTLTPGKYPIPAEGVMSAERYIDFFVERVAAAVEEAWKARTPGSVAWGLGHAVVAYNRRAVYANGSAQMYGRTNTADFRHLEGYEDHDVHALFFWNAEGRLLAAAVSVACPAQEVEGRSAVNADYWHPVRQALQKRFGDDLVVVGWIAASGDQSPHLMYRHAADERMQKLRGLDRLGEIARRIDRAVEEAYEAVQEDRHTDVALVHRAEVLELPMRLVTEAEYAEARRTVEDLTAQIAANPAAAPAQMRRMLWFQRTVERYERQQEEPSPTYPAEIHVLRIGDVAICTNPFELFTDFGIRIQARSKAVQTIVVQLAGPGSYVPTERAVRGGGYSAVVHSSQVGPEGGQVLVDRTVERLQALWP